MSEEFISRGAALAAIFARIIRYPIDSDIRPAYEDALEAIGCLPAADVMPVVRCKDCGYFGEHLMSGYHACERYELPFCKPDDFCSHGERMAKGGA